MLILDNAKKGGQASVEVDARFQTSLSA